MEWKTEQLGNLITIKYGKDHKKLKDGPFPVYGSGGIMRFVDTAIYNKPSLLLPRKGSLNNIMFTDKPFWTVDTMFWSIIDESKIEPKFLYYAMCKKNLVALNVGTSVPSLTVPVLEDVSIPYPPIPIQRKIAGILSALDSKIENNNKINANLEAQAQALFKSWFVDFTPFKDKPFVDSELGPIPQGWKVGKLGDYVEIKRGGSPRPIQKFLASQGLNWLKISDATSTQSPFIFNIKEKIIIDGLKKTVFLKAGSLVLSNSATPCIPKFLSIDSCIHDGWLYFPHSQLPENYLYLFFKLMRNNLVSKANGSVFLNLKTDIVKNQVFAFSGEEIYNSFDKIIAPLFKEIENLTYETFQLSALRDTLLPKLMSGEIKL